MAKAALISDLIAIRAETLKSLGMRDGTTWAKSSGELHYQYKEMPNWIELAKAEDLHEAHVEFLKIFAPYFNRLGEVNLTVSYSVGKTQLAFLNSNDEIRTASASPDFGNQSPKHLIRLLAANSA